MMISVLQENLQKGLSIVTKAVEGKPTLPVLANVLLEAEAVCVWRRPICK